MEHCENTDSKSFEEEVVPEQDFRNVYTRAKRQCEELEGRGYDPSEERSLIESLYTGSELCRKYLTQCNSRSRFDALCSLCCVRPIFEASMEIKRCEVEPLIVYSCKNVYTPLLVPRIYDREIPIYTNPIDFKSSTGEALLFDVEQKEMTSLRGREGVIKRFSSVKLHELHQCFGIQKNKNNSYEKPIPKLSNGENVSAAVVLVDCNNKLVDRTWIRAGKSDVICVEVFDVPNELRDEQKLAWIEMCKLFLQTENTRNLFLFVKNGEIIHHAFGKKVKHQVLHIYRCNYRENVDLLAGLSNIRCVSLSNAYNLSLLYNGITDFLKNPREDVSKEDVTLIAELHENMRTTGLHLASILNSIASRIGEPGRYAGFSKYMESSALENVIKQHQKRKQSAKERASKVKPREFKFENATPETTMRAQGFVEKRKRPGRPRKDERQAIDQRYKDWMREQQLSGNSVVVMKVTTPVKTKRKRTVRKTTDKKPPAVPTKKAKQESDSLLCV